MLARTDGVIDAHVGEVLVLHDPSGDRYVRLNQSAEVVWTRLAQPCTIGELARALSLRYGVELRRALADVEQLVAALLERGMLTPIN